MKTLQDEPSDLILGRIYRRDQTRNIIIDGKRGTISGGGGGWGNTAICCNFDGVEIIARERESEDYEQQDSGRLEVYRWERADEPGIYYYLLADAINKRDSTDKAL